MHFQTSVVQLFYKVVIKEFVHVPSNNLFIYIRYNFTSRQLDSANVT